MNRIESLKEKKTIVQNNKVFFFSSLIVLLLLIIISFILAVSLGSVQISFSETWKIIFGKWFDSSLLDGISKSHISIVYNLRMPRTILALLCGMGLALCGTVMQSTVNNPISEPYILGVSSGATFGATFIMVLGANREFLAIGSFFGALLATFIVLLVARGKKKITTLRLILSGTVVNALFTAFSNFIISVWGTSDSVLDLKFWTMGSLASAKYSSLILPAIIVIVIFAFFLTQGRILNVMMMGDSTASTLGINLPLYRVIYLTLIAILTGVLVANCGLIGFVGLIIPHLSRAIVGSNHKRLVPFSALLGGIFLIWADVLARTLVENAELPIGIFTALIGAPFFIYIVARKDYGK